MLENLDIETAPAPQAAASRRTTSSRYHRKDVFPIIAHDWLRFLLIELGGIILLEGITWLLLSSGTLLLSMFLYSQLLSVGLTSGIAIGIVYFTAEKRALCKYIEAVRLEQKRYERTYVALSFTHVAPSQEAFNALEETQPPTQQQPKHLLLIGIPGAGKTIELRVRQYKTLENEQDLLKHRNKVPVFIPLNFYNAFLRDHPKIKVGRQVGSQSIESSSLMRYLNKANLPGLHHIRPFLRRWVYQGNLLFLCDGLNEIANAYLPGLCDELLQLMQHHSNHIIMTCREWDFKNQPLFQQLLKHEYIEQETIQPLSNAQIDIFVRTYINSGYVDEKGERWRYQPEQILTLIDKTHFRDECMNPLMLYIFMKIVNNLELTDEDLEVGRIAGIDTRGQLLQRFVEQLLEKRLEDERWKSFPYETETIHLFLCHIAYISRRINYRNGLPLGIHRVVTGGARPKRTKNELTLRLFDLLHEPTSQGYPLAEADMLLPYDFTLQDTDKLREFAESSTIISINEDNSLSFYHELIAEYFAAEYLLRAYTEKSAQLPFGVDLIKDVEAWKEPIRIWAGLLVHPSVLANRIAQLGKQQPEYGYNALTLGLLCLGVKLTPSTEQPKLERDLTSLFVEYIKDVEKRRVLAATINRSAYEGGIDVYRAFLPLIIYSPVDQFMLLLEHSKIIPLLFDYLKEIVRKGSPTTQLLSRTITVLAQFGPLILSQAVLLSQENPLSGLPSDKQIHLRQAAIEILGKTALPGAVQPLIALLGDKNEVEIARKAREALKQLGPALILKDMLQHLTTIQTPYLHREALQFELLRILQSFLAIDEHGVSILNFHQYTETIPAIIQLLTSEFERIHNYAHALLQREITTDSSRRNYLIDRLIGQLATIDVQFEQRIKDLLSRAGRATTPLLLQRLRQPSTSNSDLMRERIVEVLALVHDPEAIPDLLDLLDTPLPRLRERVGRALLNCRPYCIDPLIEVVLSVERTDTEAAEAAKLLAQMGRESVEKLCKSLSTVIKGRTTFLIQALAQMRDVRAIQPLIELLNASLSDETLVITLIDALGNFPDQIVVTFLLHLLERVTSPAYDKTIEVLSRLGDIALDPLISALSITEETPVAQGIRKALASLNMQPYPNERLLREAVAASHLQALQLLLVFQARGKNSAPFLISHLCAPEEKERAFVNQTLNQMSKDDILESLLAALDDSTCRPFITSLLQKYPQEAIGPLVRLLSSEKQGLAAAKTLIDFQVDINIMPLLRPALNSSNERERGHARYIIIQLVKQSNDILRLVIQMFRLLDLPQAQQAFEALLQVLVGPLATESIPYLMEALTLDERRIQEGVGEALKRLANRGDNASTRVQKGLIDALLNHDRREAAAAVIVRIGELMIDRINPLITHTDTSISAIAHRIMTSIGAGTLPHIYANLQVQDPRTLEATMKIFRELKASEIRLRLVELLADSDPQKVQMAVTLLLLRLREDLSPLPTTDKKMLSELLHYIQRYKQSDEVMRIVAFLLLLPKSILLQQLNNHLFSYPSHSIAWLTPLFLLLGMQGNLARDELHVLLGNTLISTELHAQIIGILGMLSEDKFAFQHASYLNQIAQTNGGATLSSQAEIARHALGGLLVGNQWNDSRLRQLLQTKADETYEHELYSILLGGSYIPRLQKVRGDLLRAEEQVKQLQGELQRTKQTLQDTQRLLEAKKYELIQAENKYQTLYESYQRQQDVNNTLSSKKSEAENTNRYLQQQVEQLTSRNLQLQQRIEKLESNSIRPYPPHLH